MQRCILAILTLAACAGAQAASESVDINLVTSQSVGQAIGSASISTPTAAASPRLKRVKPSPLAQQAGTTIRKKPVSMKVPTAPVTSAICRSWWSITMVKQPSRWSRRA